MVPIVRTGPHMLTAASARPIVPSLAFFRSRHRTGTWIARLASLGVVSCAVPATQTTPAAEVVKVYGAWSYCESPATASLPHENAKVLKSAALLARSGTPYDLLIVPGYTPDDAKEPLAHVHPVAAARLDEAVALYREGKSHIVLVSGGNVAPTNTPYTEALTMKAYLLERGLPESAIVVEPCARHSTTNLRNAGRFMLKYHLRTALVVTSADQAYYFANGRISTFEGRSRADLGYMVGDLKHKTATSVEFAPSDEVLRRGPDALDP
jgi:DUF218 domain